MRSVHGGWGTGRAEDGIPTAHRQKLYSGAVHREAQAAFLSNIAERKRSKNDFLCVPNLFFLFLVLRRLYQQQKTKERQPVPPSFFFPSLLLPSNELSSSCLA